MNTMHIPRFTAENSLAEAAHTYRISDTIGKAMGIVPATVNCIKICGGDPDCIYCCRCVSRGGHPSHCCF